MIDCDAHLGGVQGKKKKIALILGSESKRREGEKKELSKFHYAILSVMLERSERIE